MKKIDKLTLYYNIGHLIGFALIYIISLIISFMCIKNFFIRIVVVPLLFLVCAWFEERVMVFVVNPIVWFFLPEDVRKKEIEIAKKALEAKKRKNKKEN